MLTVTDSTIADTAEGIQLRHGDGRPSAIDATRRRRHRQRSGTMTVTDSTIANNSATAGGGIDNGGTLTIINSTIANNSAEMAAAAS